MPYTQADLDEVALSKAEYDQIVALMSREPTPVELGMFGSLWSEHCGYKNSKPLLRLFPTEGEHIMVEAGKENAGVIDIGDGYAIVMKIESHNHPSAIEPYEGAATGVGGIVRDIFAMGARPIALLNSLRFGPPKEGRNGYLFSGVVSGISGYGNCLGIPNVGGEVVFSSCYTGNPLVNAMCVGLIKGGKVLSAKASTPGNLLMVVGADTGRDGIHGASGLASRTLEDDRELRSAVQVGNPFMEKLLLEACLELAETDWLEALQDLGAAGLTSAAVECVAKGGTGLDIDVLKVPRRATGMTAYDVMLSESQERMLAVVKPEFEAQVRALFEKYDLTCAVIGTVIEEQVARIREGETIVAEGPVQALTKPPEYRREGVEAPEVIALRNFDLSGIPDAPPAGNSWSNTLLALLGAPNVASKRPVFRQYDHQVLTNTVVSPGADAAVLRIKGTTKGIALATDGNARMVYLDPQVGGAMVIAEATRNVVCTGARPVAVTDCLNFGNPERPSVYYQLEHAILGMAEACRTLRTPVISGNVSLYNESGDQAIYPTPIVGVLGILEDVATHCTPGFKAEGDAVYLLGDDLSGAAVANLAGSEYLSHFHNLVAGQPKLDLALEERLQVLCLDLIQRGIVKSAHDCADGGLAVALAESCMHGSLGLDASGLPVNGRADALLFGETASRIVVSIAPERSLGFESAVRTANVPYTKLGNVAGDRLVIGRLVNLEVSRALYAWEHGLA